MAILTLGVKVKVDSISETMPCRTTKLSPKSECGYLHGGIKNGHIRKPPFPLPPWDCPQEFKPVNEKKKKKKFQTYFLFLPIVQAIVAYT